MSSNRRQFLQMTAGAMSLGLLTPSIERALALPGASSTGTISDVEHIVIFMQENRSFDHYLGHLPGVRGYNDRFPVLRHDGKPIWHQPRNEDPDEAVLPFRLQANKTSAECVLDLDHGWYPTHGAINGGRNDQWPKHKSNMTMGYYERADLPFHYALADAFTVCDAYFCSTPNQTHPNRMYLMTGTVDPTGTGGGPLLDNNDYVDRLYEKKILPPFTYTTYPERLQAAGITWQIYQQGTSDEDDFNGNFGTNVLGNFKQFIEAPEGSPLHRRGMSQRTLEHLKQDVVAKRLPQVSWLLPPAAYSEHPTYTPGYGATYIARILDALTADPEVWSRTALFVMYDENDGYFDHVPPPQPPTPVMPGRSTITTDGEIHNYVNPLNSESYHADNLPYGLGPRVPMIVVSPWTKGGHVCSEVFDHTSLIRFIEKRFGVDEPNITAWRRAICGDLTSAFDFATPNVAWPSLPDTSNFITNADAECKLPKPRIPIVSVEADVTAQELGSRPARALPYDLAVDELSSDRDTLALRLINRGAVGACFYVYREHSKEVPRRFTIEAGKSLDDIWDLSVKGNNDLFTVAGPNGFIRRYRGNSQAPLLVSTQNQPESGRLVLALSNQTAGQLAVDITDNAYGQATRTITVPPGQMLAQSWDATASGCWYDVTVSVAGNPVFERRLAGHVETGKPSISDPAAHAPSLA
ncbi:MAG: plcN [Rhodospirillales bacterium]|nr:plcN [Rhodospirillales bacterium]